MSKPVEVEKVGADSPLEGTGKMCLLDTCVPCVEVAVHAWRCQFSVHSELSRVINFSLFPLPPTQIQSGMDLNQITRYIWLLSLLRSSSDAFTYMVDARRQITVTVWRVDFFPSSINALVLFSRISFVHVMSENKRHESYCLILSSFFLISSVKNIPSPSLFKAVKYWQPDKNTFKSKSGPKSSYICSKR